MLLFYLIFVYCTFFPLSFFSPLCKKAPGSRTTTLYQAYHDHKGNFFDSLASCCGFGMPPAICVPHHWDSKWSDSPMWCWIGTATERTNRPTPWIFFWEPVITEPSLAYAKACLKAVSFLQIFFNLKITNYYCAGMLIYRELNIEHQSAIMAYNFPLKVNDLPKTSATPHYRDSHS